MGDRPDRESLTYVTPPLRIEPSIGEEIEQLAHDHTDGKFSRMARVLLHEALAARRARTQAEADSA